MDKEKRRRHRGPRGGGRGGGASQFHTGGHQQVDKFMQSNASEFGAAPQDGGKRRRRGPGRGGFGGDQHMTDVLDQNENGSGAEAPLRHKNANGSAFADAPQPALSEAVPKDTPRFAELLGSSSIQSTLIETITQDLKFDHMMPVQSATLHELLPPKRSDCLVQAKTGTGKTVAFLLPALQTLIESGRLATKGGGISLLVISPTRELAMQIAKEATNLLQRMRKYRVSIAIGGTNKTSEEKQILAGCDVLIATPGRLIDHLSNENIRYSLRALDTLVLDEADRLLDMGFKRDLSEIVRQLPDKLKTKRQGMLFSATIAPHVEQVANLVLSPGYKFISTIPEGEANTHQRVPQLLVKVPTFSDVVPAMVNAIREEATQHTNFKAIVFAPTAALAGLYGHILSSLSGSLPPVMTLHSRITQSRRTKTTNEYRDASSAILCATDVVARGMDFPGVTTVFQVGIPADKESYIHRLGRTARAGAEGRGIFIVAEAETWFPRWNLKDINFIEHSTNYAQVADEIYKIVVQMEDGEKAKVYQAWLGYYKNHMKGLKWDRELLVHEGNVYAKNGLGAPETPSIAKSTVGKMGLKGTKGLVVVPDPPRHGGGRGGGGGGGRGGRR